MLVRVILTGELLGLAGQTTLSVAQILGVSDTNNRRDQICSALLIHDAWMVQVVEGRRADVDRMLQRMRSDRRLSRLTVISDAPIHSRTLTESAGYCHHPADTLSKVGLSRLEAVTIPHVEAMLDYRQAA